MLRPLPAHRWNSTAAAHLLNRAGFGGTPQEVHRLLEMGCEEAVSVLVDYDKVVNKVAEPLCARQDVAEPSARQKQFRQLRQQIKAATPEARPGLESQLRVLRQQEQRASREQLVDLRHWWLQRMSASSRPLEEKLTLFWHHHFATSIQKVKDPFLMWRQNETFRQHASGRFFEMLRAVTQDPAMLIWLDQAKSRRRHPNENYAREMLELFTLGEGHYTEADVTEVARAFTGLTLDETRRGSTFRGAWHDRGTKTVLGRTGNLGWEEVLHQILAQPQVARHLVAKVWQFFVSEEVSEPAQEALATVLRESDLQIKTVLRVLFRSEEFYADAIVRGQVKSPVQWLVSSARLLQRPIPGPNQANNILRILGQELFAPPNVKGWDGGRSWITTSTLLARYNFAAILVYGHNQASLKSGTKMLRFLERRLNRRRPQPGPVDVTQIVSSGDRIDNSKLVAALERRFLQGDLKPKQRVVLSEFLSSQGELDDGDVLEAVRLIMSTPEYQLA